MGAKHTPGPWEWRDNERTGSGVELVGRSGPVLDIYESHGGGNRPNEDNARLIADGPDLLSVAKRILDRGYVSESIEEERGDYLALVAAIARAEGR